MKRFRLIGVSLLAVFALCAIAASGAQAESAPFFSINGTRLTAGQTHNVAAHGIKAFELVTPASGNLIKCEKLTAEKGVLLGSVAGEPGKDNEISKFTECKLESGNGAPECKLETTTITTNQLVSELVENVVEGKGGKKLLEEFRPASAAAGFVTIKFTGAGCTVKETVVSGQTVAEIVTDNTAEENVELGQALKEATSWKVRFPAAAIESVWLVRGGTGKVQRTEQVAFGNVSEQKGTALVLLANAKFEPENVQWSPLP